ncbi:hypothetical protein [Pyxidicoccus trucidator]|uniref:hypothetical protein n=1 Tax=Pyxidicoccus trucidator TaxID=2709662 RepID=UPI0013D9F138|nr:hypothetical protein [Pyxidicoccus trucidator]
MRWMWGWIAVLPLLTACGENEPSKLADLKGLRLDGDVNPFERSYVQRYVYLELEHDGAECVTMSSDVKAFVNDIEVPLVIPGGVDADTGGCHIILFALESDRDALPFPVFDDGLTRVRITDGDTHLEADIASLCTPRTFALRTPADGVLRAGTEVDIEWLPATDELLVETVQVSRSVERRIDFRAAEGKLQAAGNHVRLTWPQLPEDWTGPATLWLEGGLHRETQPYRNPAQRCDGFVSCQVDCAPQMQLNLQVQLAG